LPESNTRPERQLELLFGIGTTHFSPYNYINTQSDSAQISRNKNWISSLTHIVEIQEDHLKHIDSEVANDRIFYLQNLQHKKKFKVQSSSSRFGISRHHFSNKHYLKQIPQYYPATSAKTAFTKLSTRINNQKVVHTPTEHCPSG
jgi:hypothetical protein